MMIKVIWLLVISFFSLSLSGNKEETHLDVSSLKEVKSISKDCPMLFKIIEDNNIASYTIKCGPVDGNVKKINNEVVLRGACSMVHNMLLYICENQINITSLKLDLDEDEKMSVCPFNFLHLTHLDTFNVTNIEKILTIERYCYQVCYDFDEPRMQCLVLNKVNNYIKSLNVLKQNSLKKSEVLSEATKTEVNSSSNFLKTDVKNEDEKGIDGTLFEKKNVTEEREEETIPAQITSAINSGVHLNNQIVNNGHKLFEESIKKKEEKNNQLLTEVEQKFTLSTKSITSKSESKPSNLLTDESSFNNEDVIKEGDEGEEDHELIDTDSQNLKVPENENKSLVPKDSSLDSSVQSQIYSGEGFFQAEDSHFFFYFLMCSSIVIIGYLAFHNKKKIIAFALEGRNGRRIQRRPNPARYRKLESNLEEVIASNDSYTSGSSVVY